MSAGTFVFVIKNKEYNLKVILYCQQDLNFERLKNIYCYNY